LFQIYMEVVAFCKYEAKKKPSKLGFLKILFN
jgi:hypothetical protein